MNAEKFYEYYLQSSGVTTDSRLVQKGSMFFALKGPNFNGNTFAAQAIEKGAAFAVVDESQFADHPQCILVDNAYEALVNLARFHRKQIHCPVFAITGSNGKTTTKELIVQVLLSTYSVAFTKGNLNNHIGLPLTILSANTNTEIMVLEMGANQPGDIDFLCSIGQPDYGIITNVGKAHLEGFGSPEGVFQTKTELYRYVIANGKGLIVHAENDALMNAAAGHIIMTYGIHSGNVIGTITKTFPYLSMKWTANNMTFDQPTNLFGSYNIYNVLAAVSTGLLFGIQPELIVNAISAYQPTNNRSQYLVTAKNNKVILDAYNANPSSIHLALDEFLAMQGNPKYIILGSMMELGKYSIEEHRNVLMKLQKFSGNFVFLVGQEFLKIKNEFREFQYFENSDALKNFLTDINIANAFILLKGSRVNTLENLISCL